MSTNQSQINGDLGWDLGKNTTYFSFVAHLGEGELMNTENKKMKIYA